MTRLNNENSHNPHASRNVHLMRRRFPALERVSGPTAGFLAVGLSGFVLLASGPRLVGTANYSLLAVTWTISNIFGVGLALPGEQAVSRATAVQEPGEVSKQVRRRLLVMACVTSLVPLAGLAGVDPVLGDSQSWSWSFVLAAFGWAVAAPARGVLAGHGVFRGYTHSLLAEAAARVFIVGIAWLGGGASNVLLGLALGVPLLVSASVAQAHARKIALVQPLVSPSLTRIAALSDQFWYTVVAFSTQISLGLPAVLLQALHPDSGVAGSFVTASVYMRIPITFIGGLLVVVLSQVATHFSSGRTLMAARVARKALLGTLSLGLVCVLLLWLASGEALAILYGEDLNISGFALITLGCSTVAAMLAGVATQTLFGCSLARSAALLWVMAALSVAVLAALMPGTLSGMALTVLLGQVIALLATLVLLRLALRGASRRPPTDELFG